MNREQEREICKELEKLNKTLDRDVIGDLLRVADEFQKSAFLLDDKDNNGGIWLDLYKPFGNGNIVGDVRDIIFYKDEEYDEENEIILELRYKYSEHIYKALPKLIQSLIRVKIEEIRKQE